MWGAECARVVLCFNARSHTDFTAKKNQKLWVSACCSQKSKSSQIYGRMLWFLTIISTVEISMHSWTPPLSEDTNFGWRDQNCTICFSFIGQWYDFAFNNWVRFPMWSLLPVTTTRHTYTNTHTWSCFVAQASLHHHLLSSQHYIWYHYECLA